MNAKQNLILLLACLATLIALGEPSLAEKNADPVAIHQAADQRFLKTFLAQ
jgi:hypothetical protein